MKRLKFRPVIQSQFATLFVSPKPTVDEEGYASAYPSLERAIKALPKKHGGVLIVQGEFKIDRPVKLPKDVPITVVGGEYKLGRKVPSFLIIPSKCVKSNVFPGMTVDCCGAAAITVNSRR
jgi:hypothetical protein